MAERVVFRTLAMQSRFMQGKHKGQLVETITKIDPEHIVWVYFHMKDISFLPEVLDSVGIIEELRIEKPGTDKIKWQGWYINLLMGMTEAQRIEWSVKRKYNTNKKRYLQSKKREMQDRRHYSPGNMAYTNQHGDLPFRQAHQIPYYKHKLP